MTGSTQKTKRGYGVYGEGTLDPTRGYVYCALVTSASQTWAIYCLVVVLESIGIEASADLSLSYSRSVVHNGHACDSPSEPHTNTNNPKYFIHSHGSVLMQVDSHHGSHHRQYITLLVASLSTS